MVIGIGEYFWLCIERTLTLTIVVTIEIENTHPSASIPHLKSYGFKPPDMTIIARI